MPDSSPSLYADVRTSIYSLRWFLQVLAWEGLALGLVFISQSREDATVLGRYDLDYLVFLIVYHIVAALAIGAAYRSPDSWFSWLLPVIRLLQRYPVTIGLAALGLIEAWYSIKNSLRSARLFFHEDWVMALGVAGDRVLMPLMLVVGLLFVTTWLMLVLAGRDPNVRRELSMNLSLGLIAGVVAFVLFSFGYALIIRSGTYPSTHRFWWDLHIPDPATGYRLRPSVDSFVFYSPDVGQTVQVTTNTGGLRAASDRSQAPVAVLGDSFVFGLPLDNDDIWTAWLERDTSIQAANYGVTGYAFWQYNVTAAKLQASSHRVVVYAIFANDLNDDSTVEAEPRLQRFWYFAPYRTPIHFTVFELLSSSPIGTGRIMLAEYRRQATTGAGTHSILPNGLQPLCEPRPWAYPRQMTPYLDSQVARAIELAEERGYRLVFLLIPSKESVYDGLAAACGPAIRQSVQAERESFAALCGAIERRGGKCRDLSATFRDHALLTYLPVDPHWNSEGHRLFASEVYDVYTEALAGR